MNDHGGKFENQLPQIVMNNRMTRLSDFFADWATFGGSL